MKKSCNTLTAILAGVGTFLVLGSILIISIGLYINLTMRPILERAYFNGQRDAINGQVRIKLNSDSTYVWTESPWDNNILPTYTPTYLDSRNILYLRK